MNYDIRRNLKLNNSKISKKKNLDDLFERKEKENLSFSFIGIADGLSKNWEEAYKNKMDKQ